MTIRRLFRFSPRSFGINLCGICWRRSVNGTGSYPNNSVSPVRIIAPTLDTLLHVQVFVTGRRSGRRLGALNTLQEIGKRFVGQCCILFWSAKGWAYTELCFGKYIYIFIYIYIRIYVCIYTRAKYVQTDTNINVYTEAVILSASSVTQRYVLQLILVCCVLC